jgi:hypothetical protein
MSLSKTLYGLGDQNAQFNVYIANLPEFSEYSSLDCIKPLSAGEIHAIGLACGNGWRKVFNVYAKLLFALNAENIVSLQESQSWQYFRDHVLLQNSSNTSLLFSAPQLTNDIDTKNIMVHIIMGKTYAKSLDLPHSLTWLDHEFAIDIHSKLVVCPYFDYRQLSNIKIMRLVELIKQLREAS